MTQTMQDGSVNESPSCGETALMVDVSVEEGKEIRSSYGQQEPLETAFDCDTAAWSKAKPSTAEYLLHASTKSGRGAIALALEFAKLRMGRGHLTLQEYVQYGVYNTSLTLEEKERFLTNTIHWPITHQCCDMTWQATTEDKWLCSHILERTNVPVPRTLAVIDKSERVFPGTRKITSVSELRNFVLSQQDEPFFGKTIRGICSFGAFLVSDAEPDRLHLKGHGWIDYDRFMGSFVGSTSYLLQACQQNHSFFDRYTDNLATVRVCILVTDRGVKIPFSVLKIPTRENIADSFWREGNLACDLDPKTGKVLTARTKDAFGTEDYTKHPQSGAPLVGETIPNWDRLLELVHNGSSIFEPVRYQSMDIAVTNDGPMLIEVNTGGGFDLPQLASGRGFLADDVRAFFRANGVKKM